VRRNFFFDVLKSNRQRIEIVRFKKESNRIAREKYRHPQKKAGFYPGKKRARLKTPCPITNGKNPPETVLQAPK
jgi:hypothetical protein